MLLAIVTDVTEVVETIVFNLSLSTPDTLLTDHMFYSIASEKVSNTNNSTCTMLIYDKLVCLWLEKQMYYLC